jgi:hypothetical protein
MPRSKYQTCEDCSGPTEWYMVHNHLWPLPSEGGYFLCIGCLEIRLGRQLNRADFTDAPVNHYTHHPRLVDRMGRV